MSDLGELLTTHPTRITRIVLKGFYTLFTIGFAGMMGALVLNLSRRNGVLDAGLLLLMPLFVGVCSLMLFSTLRLIWQYPQIEVYERGLRQITRFGSAAWHWEDFDTLRIWIETAGIYGIPMFTYGDYGLFIDGKKVLGISYDYARVKRLHEDVFNKTAEVFVPRYIERYNRGETIEFSSSARIAPGKPAANHILINREGITRKRKLIPWSEIVSVNPASGSLMIHRHNRGTPMQIPIARMHNGHVMALFIDGVIGGKARQLIPPKPAPLRAAEARWRTILRLQVGKFSVVYAVVVGIMIAGVIILRRNHDLSFLGISILLLPPLLLWTLVSMLLAFNRHLTATPDGLRLKTLWRDQAWRWDEFTALTICRTGIIPIIPTQSYVLSIGNHKALSVNRFDYIDGDRWVRQIVRRNYALLPDYRQRFQQGELLHFGKIALTQAEFQHGRRKIDWVDIRHYQQSGRRSDFRVGAQEETAENSDARNPKCLYFARLA